MSSARRDALQQADLRRAEHPGLLLSSYLASHDDGKKREILEQAIAACGRSAPVYKLAWERWRASLPAGTQTRMASTRGRFVTGLGAASPLEAGIRLHHTYGTALIPGSGLKGLASHYCHEIWGQKEGFREGGEFYRTLFGTTAEAGMIVFHDAWITPAKVSASLVMDVMTPHHQGYTISGQAPPSDFDSPIPVPFLSITGQFLIALSPTAPGPAADRWTALALKLVLEALAACGAGAKTRSGYGRFRAE